METLSHHLFHFWTVVREREVTRASEKLDVSQPTISGQLRELEEALGEKLLARSGRTLVLTDIGRTVYRYADEMLALDRELLEAVKGRPVRPGRLESMGRGERTYWCSCWREATLLEGSSMKAPWLEAQVERQDSP